MSSLNPKTSEYPSSKTLDKAHFREAFFEVFPEFNGQASRGFNWLLAITIYTITLVELPDDAATSPESVLDEARRKFGKARINWLKFQKYYDYLGFQTIDLELGLAPFICINYLSDRIDPVAFQQKTKHWYISVLNLPKMDVHKSQLIHCYIHCLIPQIFVSTAAAKGFDHLSEMELIFNLIISIADSLSDEEIRSRNQLENKPLGLDFYFSLDPGIKDRFFPKIKDGFSPRREKSVWSDFFDPNVPFHPYVKVALYFRGMNDGIENLSYEALGSIYGIEG